MTGTAERVDVAVARAIWQAGDTVVDVRTAQEYAHGHLPGAVNVPVDSIAFRVAELPAGQVLTVCSMGNRSWRAAQLLANAGREALSLTGGTKAWSAAGMPLVTGPEPGERAHRRRFGWRHR
jgi:rhodanese-related sulfurtransferase